MGFLSENSTCCSTNDNLLPRFAHFNSGVSHTGKHTLLFKGHLDGKGQIARVKIVVKAGRGTKWDESHCKRVVSRCERIKQLCQTFNGYKFVDAKLKTIVPRMAVMDEVASRRLRRDEWVLFEERVREKFQTFLHGDGLVKDEKHAWLRLFVHFTYAATRGELVVSRLRGAHSGNVYAISEPAVHSRDGRFGESDQGLSGIRSVFGNHRCCKLCRDWPRPDVDETRRCEGQTLYPTLASHKDADVSSTDSVFSEPPPEYSQIYGNERDWGVRRVPPQ